MFSKQKHNVTIKDFLLKFKEVVPEKVEQKPGGPKSLPKARIEFNQRLDKIKGAFALFGHIPKVDGHRTSKMYIPKRSLDNGRKKK